jgi:hypothetical protein
MDEVLPLKSKNQPPLQIKNKNYKPQNGKFVNLFKNINDGNKRRPRAYVCTQLSQVV